MRRYTVVLLAAAIVYLFCEVQTSTKSDSKSWDYLIFTQQWIPAVCHDPIKMKCFIPKNVTGWTIHGIWPGKYSSHDISFCNKSWHFNVEELQTILEKLNLEWPSDEEKNYATFWKHEWEKHGTCVATLPELNSILKYFSGGLNFSDVYNLTKALGNSGIVPNTTKPYLVTDVSNAITSAFGKTSVLQCTFIKGGIALLSSVEVCMNKNMETMDCPKKGNCNNATLIYLPMPNHLSTHKVDLEKKKQSTV